MIDDGTGPSDETLKHLRDNLNTLGPAMAKGEVGGKGRKVFASMGPTMLPHKMCRICQANFDFKPDLAADYLPVPGVCPKCQGSLDEGYTALIDGGKRYAFIKQKLFPPGKIVTVSEELMTAVKQKLNENKAKTN